MPPRHRALLTPGVINTHLTFHSRHLHTLAEIDTIIIIIRRSSCAGAWSPLLLWDLFISRTVETMLSNPQMVITKLVFPLIQITVNNNTNYQLTLLILGHPRFFNQLSCGLDVTSLAGEWLTATANTNMFTYEIAPVFILMEHEVLKKMREIIGYEAGDSILAPGGSISNMYALMIARHKLFPQHKKYGMRAIKGQLMMYTSQHVSRKMTKYFYLRLSDEAQRDMRTI